MPVSLLPLLIIGKAIRPLGIEGGGAVGGGSVEVMGAEATGGGVTGDGVIFTAATGPGLLAFMLYHFSPSHNFCDSLPNTTNLNSICSVGV